MRKKLGKHNICGPVDNLNLLWIGLKIKPTDYRRTINHKEDSKNKYELTHNFNVSNNITIWIYSSPECTIQSSKSYIIKYMVPL